MEQQETPEEVKPARNLIKHLREFLGSLVKIGENIDYPQTLKKISDDVEFKGYNIWILIASIFIASIGLNANSAAVIIGAMLISPLMGPIRGIGYALSANDFKVLIQSLKNFGIMVAASVLASYLFYLVTPIKSETSELLSRTKPQVLDILIAFFGGLAGVIATTVKNKANTITVIPGVAIATALMPPLCTVGYGMAVGNWSYFIGAFYLFLLNSVFICLSTFMVLRLLNFPKVKFVNPKIERKVKMYVFTILLLIVIPSVFKFYHIINESIFIQNADNFIKSEIIINPEIEVLTKELNYDDQGSEIVLNIGGKYINEEQINNWKLQLSNYDISNVNLEIHNLQSKAIDEEELLNKILVDNDKKIMSISEERDLYKSELQSIIRENNALDELNTRILTHFPAIKSLNYGQSFIDKEGVKDTNFVFVIKWNNDTLKNFQKSYVESFINTELNTFYSNANKVLIFNK